MQGPRLLVGQTVAIDATLLEFDPPRRQRDDGKAYVTKVAAEAGLRHPTDASAPRCYKAEHVVNLDSNLILSAEIHPADQADSATLPPSRTTAQLNLFRAGNPM